MASPHHPRSPYVALFARAPEPGRVKTRLAASVGPERALSLYAWLAARVFAGLMGDGSHAYHLAVHYTPADADAALRAWLPGADAYVPQTDGDLGARLAHAVATGFGAGHDAVVLVGTDCLAVDAARIDAALHALTSHDAVLGPAADGGYYLLGLRRPLAVFEGIPWSTATVADATRAALERLGARRAELPVARDVDTVEDLTVVAERPDAPGWVREVIRGAP